MSRWRVLWIDSGKWKQLVFGDVKDAVSKGKELKRQGYETHVVSGQKAYPPYKTEEVDGRRRRVPIPRPSSKHMWCPFCIKWQIFIYRRIRLGGITGPAESRCPVCTISVRHYYIKLYNGLFDVDVTKLTEGIRTFQRS